MKMLISTLLLASTSAFAGGKYMTVTIDEKKLAAQKPASDSAQEYVQKIKSLLKRELKTVDVYLKDEDSLKWLFVTVKYKEWRSLQKNSRKELVELLLRQMKQTYPDKGLQVSVGIDASQPLAEGSWGQLSDGPNVKLIGE